MVLLVCVSVGLLFSSTKAGLTLGQMVAASSVGHVEAFWIYAVPVKGTAGAGDRR